MAWQAGYEKFVKFKIDFEGERGMNTHSTCEVHIFLVMILRDIYMKKKIFRKIFANAVQSVRCVNIEIEK